MIVSPWCIAGNFNLVRWMIDRSGDLRCSPLMDLFNDFITNSGLVDLPIKNRCYTWSNKRPNPSFSRLDRVFFTPDFQVNYPIVTLEALEMVISDHVPLLLTCKNNAPLPSRSKLEAFWLKYEMPKEMIRQLWEEDPNHLSQPLQSFHCKTKILHKALSSWHKQNFGTMEKQLTFCKKLVLFFDMIEEKRNLSPHEFQLRCKIKKKAIEMANNIEERWRQRSCCNWLEKDDKNMHLPQID